MARLRRGLARRFGVGAPVAYATGWAAPAALGDAAPLMWLREQWHDLLDATRFLSRLPLPGSPAMPAPLAATLRLAPLAGVLIAAGPALMLVLGMAAGLSSLVGATLAVGLLVLATGALHEDGWADVADGFGGGQTVERKLAIMRDSRIGSYGALALGLGLILRVAGLESLVAAHGARPAALALLAAAALSRTLMLVPLALLPPARPDGLVHAVAADGAPMLGTALALGLPVTAALGFPALPGTLQVAAAMVFATAASFGMTRLARRQVGGVTGDVVGATQQAAEIAFLVALGLGPRPG